MYKTIFCNFYLFFSTTYLSLFAKIYLFLGAFLLTPSHDLSLDKAANICDKLNFRGSFSLTKTATGILFKFSEPEDFQQVFRKGFHKVSRETLFILNRFYWAKGGKVRDRHGSIKTLFDLRFRFNKILSNEIRRMFWGQDVNSENK